MRGISALLALLISLSFSTAQAEVRLLAWERPPLSSASKDGGKGLVIDLAGQMFRRAGVDYQIVFVPLQRAMMSAQRDANSCVLLVERRQERESSYAWVGPLLISRLGLYALPGNPLQLDSLEQARDLRILSHQGSGGGEYLRAQGFRVEFSNKEVLSYAMLQNGRAPLWAASPLVVRSLVRKGQPEPREVLPFLTLMEDMACHPQMDSAVLSSLRQALNALYAEGEVARLYERYGVSLE